MQFAYVLPGVRVLEADMVFRSENQGEWVVKWFIWAIMKRPKRFLPINKLQEERICKGFCNGRETDRKAEI